MSYGRISNDHVFDLVSVFRHKGAGYQKKCIAVNGEDDVHIWCLSFELHFDSLLLFGRYCWVQPSGSTPVFRAQHMTIHHPRKSAWLPFGQVGDFLSFGQVSAASFVTLQFSVVTTLLFLNMHTLWVLLLSYLRWWSKIESQSQDCICPALVTFKFV